MWLRRVLDAERDRLVLFGPVLTGAGVAAYFGLRHEPALAPVAATAVVVALGAIASRRRPVARAVALGTLLMLIGVLAAACATRRALPVAALPRHAVVLAGTVRAVDVLPDGGRRLTLGAPTLDGGASLARTLRVRLRADDPIGPLADGATVSVRALLRPPPPPAYPGGWDTQRDAFFAGSAGSGFAIGDATRTDATGTDATGGPGAPAARRGPFGAVADAVRAWRDRVAARIYSDLPGPRGAIAATLLVGITAAIPEADRTAFADSGLAHLLAVAGLHIGIVMGLALGIARTVIAASPFLALRLPGRQVAALVALVAGGVYLVATGAHVPIVRSFGMASIATVALLIGRRPISMRGLAAAAGAILLVWPFELTGVSFQMSFAAVAALIAGYEIARPVFARLSGGFGRRIVLHVAALALTSLLAGTASAPFAAYHFGRIQLYFVLANVVAVPLTASWVMPWGLVALALMPFGLAGWALQPMGWGIGLILAVAHAVASARGAVILVPQLPVGFLLLTGAGIALLCLLRTPVRLVGLVPLVLAVAVGAAWRPPDLVVSDDARLIALDAPGAMLLEKTHGGSRFTVASYQRLWARPADPVRLPLSGTVGAAACTDAGCRITTRHALVVLVRGEDASPDCRGAAILIAARPLRDACPAVARIDRFSVWRDGATAAWLGRHGAVVVSDRAWRGARPWVTPPPVRRKRAKSVLPQAAAE